MKCLYVNAAPFEEYTVGRHFGIDSCLTHGQLSPNYPSPPYAAGRDFGILPSEFGLGLLQHPADFAVGGDEDGEGGDGDAEG